MRVQQSLAEIVKDARRSAGLSQIDLAGQIGKSKQAVSCYERGVYSPTIPVLIQIAECCETTVSDMFNTLSTKLGIEVSDSEVERSVLQRELEMSHDTLDRVDISREPTKGQKLPYSVPERIGLLSRAFQVIKREHEATHDDLDLHGIKNGEEATLPERVRMLIRSKIHEETKLYVLKLATSGAPMGYDIAIEERKLTQDIELATKRSLAESRARAGLLGWAGITVEIVQHG
jgi:transcriptional regulator with XRE-family HTH domain